MTLKFMQGFETMADDSDFRNQGWLFAPTKMYTALTPSFTGIAGATSLHLIGAGSSNTSAEGASGTPDVGFFNTGITVNQAWNAGGFTFGIAAKFNSGSALAYASGATTYNPNQMCFDGTRYWAIRNTAGSSMTVAYSTDLINWTVAPTLPVAPTATSTLSYVSGLLCLMVYTSGTTSTLYYSSNNAASWNSQTFNASGGSANTGVPGMVFATGNSSFPHMVTAGAYFPGASYIAHGVWIGTIGGTMTQITLATGALNAASLPMMRIRSFGGILISGCGLANIGVFQSATASNASLNTVGAWSTATTSNNGNVCDIAYHPTTNVWVLATSTGIQTFPNTGAAGTPVAPSGALTTTTRYSTAGMTSVWWTGTQMIAVGAAGHIITSPDGLIWTESGGRVLPQGGPYNWVGSINDGSQYVLYSDNSAGVIAVSADLLTNFTCKYAMDGTENVPSTAGIIAVVVSNAYTSLPFTLASRVGIEAAAASGGSRNISLVQTVTTLGTVAVSTTPLNHYYELKFTKVAGTTNSFTVQLYVDGTAVGSSYTVSMAGTGDTTSIMSLCLNRQATFTAYDDIYFTLDDGNGVVGPLGVCAIVAQRPETDTQAQWSRTGSASSNSLSTKQTAYSSQSGNYVSSSNVGDKDIYGTTDTLPAGYLAKAVQTEAFFSKTSATAPTANVGIKSGSSEADGATVTISTASPLVYATQVADKDPNGNIGWTSASVNAAKFVLNHVT